MDVDPERFRGWFVPRTLSANRAGRLTPDQVANLRREALFDRAVFLGFGAFVILAGLSLLPRAAGSKAPTVTEGILLFFVAIGVVMVVMGVRGALSHAVADGVVAHISGPATPMASYGRSTAFYLYIGDVRHSPQFEITDSLYHAITKGESLTAYYLPHANKLVNLEPGPEAQSSA